MADKTVIQGGFSSVKNLKLYDLQPSSAEYLINNFGTIGWSDPFPKPQLVNKPGVKVSGSDV